MAAGLHHVDRVPAGLVDHFVDGIRRSFDAHGRFDKRPHRTPTAAVVTLKNGPANAHLQGPAAFEIVQGVVQGRTLKAGCFQFLLLGFLLRFECRFDQTAAIDGIDRLESGPVTMPSPATIMKRVEALTQCDIRIGLRFRSIALFG